MSLDAAIAGIVDQVFERQRYRRPFYRQIVMSVLSIKHLRFTLENDRRVMDAVKAKLLEYPGVSREALDTALFVSLYALKGVQIGVVLADQTASDELRAVVSRTLLACVTGSTPRRD